MTPREYCNRLCMGSRRHSTTLCVTQTCHRKCYGGMCGSIHTVWYATCPLQMLWPYAWLCRSQLSCQYCNSMACLVHGPLPGNKTRCRLSVAFVVSAAWVVWHGFGGLCGGQCSMWSVQLFGVTRGCAQQFTKDHDPRQIRARHRGQVFGQLTCS